MKFKPATMENVATVLRKLAKFCEGDDNDAEAVADRLNQMLDELVSEDFFGTEGQLDPRGDHRE